jgi:hypothetical protein
MVEKRYTLKDFENEIANFFIGWVNKEYNFAYQTQKNKEEDSETDIFGISMSERPKLFLQVTRAEGDINKVAWENYKNKETKTIDADLSKWIATQIKNKNLHYQPLELKEKIILLISIDFLDSHNRKHLLGELEDLSLLSFKGIYLIQRSESEHFSTSGNKDGLVLPLKNAFIGN